MGGFFHQLRDVFLFHSVPEPGWSAGRKVAYRLWNGGVLLLSGVGIGLASLLLAYGPYALHLSFGMAFTTLLLNLLPPVLLMLLFYGLTGRAFAAFWMSALPVVGFSIGHYYKLTFRDDPLMMVDLFSLKEAGAMLGSYRLFLDWKLGLALACVVLGGLFLFFFLRYRPGRRVRIVCVSTALVLGCILTPAYLHEPTYGAAATHDHLPNRWAATQQYIARGFLYPFLHSAVSAVETPPEGYHERETELMLGQYEDADIPAEEKVNVMAVMLEAYNDFTRFGVPKLAQDVYKVWHDLEAESVSGDLVTNIFAGGTIDTERAFLTGLSTLNQFRSRTNSYAWYFRDQGYLVEGMHPSYTWFYNRGNVNENLGFEDYFFLENFFTQFTQGEVALDSIFFSQLIGNYMYKTSNEERPYFNFSVSYQGHGPYDSTSCWWGKKGDFVVENGDYSEEQQYILDNYFGSIANTNYWIGQLVETLRSDDEPVVLVLFGDHNPWMGDGNSVYEALGVDFSMDTKEGFFNYYSTRYIIWANDSAKEVLGDRFQGEGPAISPCFLMNLVFERCGWEGPAYMQATRNIAEQLPVIHTTGYSLEDGVLTNTLSPERAVLAEDFASLEFYWRKNFQYEKASSPK